MTTLRVPPRTRRQYDLMSASNLPTELRQAQFAANTSGTSGADPVQAYRALFDCAETLIEAGNDAFVQELVDDFGLMMISGGSPKGAARDAITEGIESISGGMLTVGKMGIVGAAPLVVDDAHKAANAPGLSFIDIDKPANIRRSSASDRRIDPKLRRLLHPPQDDSAVYAAAAQKMNVDAGALEKMAFTLRHAPKQRRSIFHLARAVVLECTDDPHGLKNHIPRGKNETADVVGLNRSDDGYWLATVRLAWADYDGGNIENHMVTVAVDEQGMAVRGMGEDLETYPTTASFVMDLISTPPTGRRGRLTWDELAIAALERGRSSSRVDEYKNAGTREPTVNSVDRQADGTFLVDLDVEYGRSRYSTDTRTPARVVVDENGAVVS